MSNDSILASPGRAEDSHCLVNRNQSGAQGTCRVPLRRLLTGTQYTFNNFTLIWTGTREHDSYKISCSYYIKWLYGFGYVCNIDMHTFIEQRGNMLLRCVGKVIIIVQLVHSIVVNANLTVLFVTGKGTQALTLLN